jgi:hypothetical protein
MSPREREAHGVNAARKLRKWRHAMPSFALLATL